MVFLMASFVYISCLVVITSAYMMPGGDVTHEVSWFIFSFTQLLYHLLSTHLLSVRRETTADN